MLGDWKRACTSRTLVDSALAGSHAFASFFSAPVSFADSGDATTSTTSQKHTTSHLVQLPARTSAARLPMLIDPPGFPAAAHHVVHSYATTSPTRGARARQPRLVVGRSQVAPQHHREHRQGLYRFKPIA